MAISPRDLVRLFPRNWRARYGAEFEALLESTRLTPPAVADVVRQAAVERVVHTVVGRLVAGVVLASIATEISIALAAVTPGAVRGMGWVIATFLPFGLVETGVGCRFLWCALARTRVDLREQGRWIAALFITSIAGQWGAFVESAGQAAPSVMLIWATLTGSMIQNSVIFLAMSRILPRGQEVMPLRKRPSERPLGLG